MSDLFAKLLPMAWKDVEFPTPGCRVTLEHDLAVHKYAERDGATVEATGREPMVFHTRAMFRNGIRRGKAERWPDPLYPTHFRRFLTVAADRSTGILQHPELGGITCKLRRAEAVWDANVRDGVDVECEWIETDEAGDVGLSAIRRDSPITNITIGTKDIDASLAVSRPPTVPEDTTSFEEFVDGITAIVDQASLLNRRVAGKIDAAIYRANTLVDAVNRAADAKHSPLKRSAQRVIDGALRLRDSQFTSGKPIALYRVPKVATLTAIAWAVQRSSSSLILLNPALLRKPTVRQGTMVRYYANASDDAVE